MRDSHVESGGWRSGFGVSRRGRGRLAMRLGWRLPSTPLRGVVACWAWASPSHTWAQFRQIAFTGKKDAGKEERGKKDSGKEERVNELSEMAMSAEWRAKINAEIARLKQLHTLKGHVESVVELKRLNINTIQRSYTF